MGFKTTTSALLACVAGGSGYSRELRSRTRVQKVVQIARRMERRISLAASLLGEIPSRARVLAALPQKVSRAHPLPPATQATALYQLHHQLNLCPFYESHCRRHFHRALHFYMFITDHFVLLRLRVQLEWWHVIMVTNSFWSVSSTLPLNSFINNHFYNEVYGPRPLWSFIYRK